MDLQIWSRAFVHMDNMERQMKKIIIIENGSKKNKLIVLHIYIENAY